MVITGPSGTGRRERLRLRSIRWAGIGAGRRCGRGERYDQHLPGDLTTHQPVGWWVGWVEQRAACPYVVDIVDAEVGVLEQVRGLRVYLERVFLVEQVQALLVHDSIVLQTTTTCWRGPVGAENLVRSSDQRG